MSSWHLVRSSLSRQSHTLQQQFLHHVVVAVGSSNCSRIVFPRQEAPPGRLEWFSSQPVIRLDDDDAVNSSLRDDDDVNDSRRIGSSTHHHQQPIRYATASTTTTVTSSSPPPPSQQQRPLRPIFVAATRQHVGKTSVSLALLSGLQERFAAMQPPRPIAFMKPVGQNHVPVVDQDDEQSYVVDKDVALVHQHFLRKQHSNNHSNNNTTTMMNHYPGRLRDMSPVLIPSGYTKDYLNGKIHDQDQRHAIQSAYARLTQPLQQQQSQQQSQQQPSTPSTVVLCEGTGHVAVGSIVNAGNAQVASWLGADMVLVANGGIGQCFDDLELNRQMCKAHGVRIAGVIVNKVQPAKYEQTKHYLQMAMDHHWRQKNNNSNNNKNDDDDEHDRVPLLGCIPDRPYLGCPALKDLERLLDAQPLLPAATSTTTTTSCDYDDDILISSLSTAATTSSSVHGLRLRHYRELFLVATSLEVFLKNVRSLPSRTLYVCHASRHDILLGFMGEYQRRQQRLCDANGGNTTAGEESTTDNESDSTTTTKTTNTTERIVHHHHHHVPLGGGGVGDDEQEEEWQAALVVCGTDSHPLSPQLQEILTAPLPNQEHLPPPPILLTKHSMDRVMQMFYSYTPKLNVEDENRVQTTIDHYKPYIDFDLLLQRMGYNNSTTTNENDDEEEIQQQQEQQHA